MSAITFIIDTLLSLALFVVLARLLLQWTRADFRNPLCQAVVKLTNPLILPVVAVLLIATVEVGCIFALHGVGLPPPELWIRQVLLEIARTLLRTYLVAIFLYALLSLIAPGGYSPLQSLLTTLCEPVLRPIRRVIPAIAGLDLSPLWAIILIQALLILMP
jgi:YggT family protein